jgi:tetratricopeptide (TPR) repeat protein
MNRKFKTRHLYASLTLIYLFQINGLAQASLESESLYHYALTHYEHEKYDMAINQLENAVSLEPEVAKYHHILAISYGRQAEKVNWFKAIDYAKKTLTHLKKADELEPNNLKILNDLMAFYRKAPKFLGGEIKKADETEVLIKKLSTDTNE